MVFSDNGIIQKAQEAANKTQEALEREQAELNQLYNDLADAMNNTAGESNLPGDAVEFTSVEWNDGKASTTIVTNETGYILQYQIGKTEESGWTNVTSGYKIAGLNHGDVVYGRLYNGTNGSKTSNITIQDEQIPYISEVTKQKVSDSSVNISIVANDKETGVINYKYFISTDESDYDLKATTTSNNYTFENLDTNVNYTIKTIAVDGAGNESMENIMNLVGTTNYYWDKYNAVFDYTIVTTAGWGASWSSNDSSDTVTVYYAPTYTIDTNNGKFVLNNPKSITLTSSGNGIDITGNYFILSSNTGTLMMGGICDENGNLTEGAMSYLHIAEAYGRYSLQISSEVTTSYLDSRHAFYRINSTWKKGEESLEKISSNVENEYPTNGKNGEYWYVYSHSDVVWQS